VVTIFLMNGMRLTGRLTGHDAFIVILAGPDGKETLTYKPAISTVVPGLPTASPLHRKE
jgi:RNA chaperone Hfq